MPLPPIKKYLVGGAVRDIVMGRTPKDRDYIVMGETPESMKARGFTPIDASFPVYLDQNKDEHALPRIEIRVGPTRKDFEFVTKNVTLEDDLLRRDFTMNAMAMDEDGQIIDPYGGQKDIAARILRHVSDAFGEDPLRVLRLARFRAETDFAIAPETTALCRKMVAAGELDTLTPERVSKELIKAFAAPHRSLFFTTLDEVGALEKLFPEVHALKGQTQPFQHHEEGDAYIHTLMVLDAAPKGDPLLSFCALAHDLGKGKTPQELLPSHHGKRDEATGEIIPSHEEAGAPIAENLARRLRLPTEYGVLGAKCARLHTMVQRARILRPSTFVDIFEANGGLSRINDFTVVAKIAEADFNGRISAAVRDYPDRGKKNADLFLKAIHAIAEVRLGKLATPEKIKTMSPQHIKKTLHDARIDAAKQVLPRDPQQSHAAPTKQRVGVSR